MHDQDDLERSLRSAFRTAARAAGDPADVDAVKARAFGRAAQMQRRRSALAGLGAAGVVAALVSTVALAPQLLPTGPSSLAPAATGTPTPQVSTAATPPPGPATPPPPKATTSPPADEADEGDAKDEQKTGDGGTDAGQDDDRGTAGRPLPDDTVTGRENANAYAIPLSIFPDESALPFGAEYHLTLGQRLTPPATGTQICDAVVVEQRAPGQSQAPMPVAGMQVDAWPAGGTDSVSFTVTGWAAGTGPQRFADLQQDKGACIWYPEKQQRQQPWAGHQAATSWLSTATEDSGQSTYLASRLVGDVIVSVVITRTSPDASSLKDAAGLCDQVVDRLAAENLAAAQGD